MRRQDNVCVVIFDLDAAVSRTSQQIRSDINHNYRNSTKMKPKYPNVYEARNISEAVDQTRYHPADLPR